jgi:hypothetical protein
MEKYPLNVQPPRSFSYVKRNIPNVTVEQRERALKATHYNEFAFPAGLLTIDMLSDSGTTAMTDVQWLALFLGDESYGRNKGYYVLLDTFRDIFERGGEKNWKKIIDLVRTDCQDIEKMMNEMYLCEYSNGLFNGGAVNCIKDEEICEEFEVSQTPSIIFFSENEKDYNKYDGKIDFNSLFNYAAKRMSYYVNEITKEKLSDFFAKKPDKYHVILFTSKDSTPSLYKALSKFYINKIIFGEVHKNQNELVELFKIKEFPTLMVILDEEKNKYEIYKRKLDYESLKSYLGKFADKQKSTNVAKVKEINYNIYNTLGTCSDSDGKNICLIYLTNIYKPIKKDMQLLEAIHDKYEKDHIKVFYLNYKKNKNIFKSFEDINESNAKAVIIKGKRKK